MMYRRPQSDRFENRTGKCLYCGKAPIPPNKLTDEHVVPDGLLGAFSIFNGSCDACAKIINDGFENSVQNDMFGDARAVMGITSKKSKKKKKGTKASKLRVLRRGGVEVLEFAGKEVFWVALPPVIFGPRLLLGLPMSYGRTVVEPMHFHAPDLSQRVETLGIDAIQGRVPDLMKFARFLAKIAHCWAAINFDPGSFEPVLGGFILGSVGSNIGYEMYVGSTTVASDIYIRSSHLLHFIEPWVYKTAPQPRWQQHLYVHGVSSELYLVMTVRLFCFMGTPAYNVIVGRFRPGFDLGLDKMRASLGQPLPKNLTGLGAP